MPRQYEMKIQVADLPEVKAAIKALGGERDSARLALQGLVYEIERFNETPYYHQDSEELRDLAWDALEAAGLPSPRQEEEGTRAN